MMIAERMNSGRFRAAFRSAGGFGMLRRISCRRFSLRLVVFGLLEVFIGGGPGSGGAGGAGVQCTPHGVLVVVGSMSTIAPLKDDTECPLFS